MRRVGRIGGLFLIGILIVLALVVGALFVLTRTPWGVARVGQYGIGYLQKGIQGRLHVGRVRSGSLLGGVRVADVSIIDRSGKPFLTADSAVVRYGWRNLIGRQLILDHVELWRPVVYIDKEPGDTAWNYERIFQDTTGAPPGPPKLILVDDVRIHDGRAVVSSPYTQSTPIQPDDTSRLIIRRTPRGIQRVYRFEHLEGTLPRVVWEKPDEEGKLFQIARLAGQGYVYKTPFHLRDARGQVVTRDSIVSFDAPEVRLPDTRAAIVGRVVIREPENAYDVKVTGERLAFRDLEWLYPRLPRQGGGSMDLHFKTVPRGTLWMVTNAHLKAPGTQVAGSFGIVTGDTLYFTNVNLRASPIDLKLISSMLPHGLPVDGLMVGTVIVEGPLSALTTRGDVRLSRAGASTSARWSGTLDLRGPLAARSFRADVTDLDLQLLSRLDPGLKLTGAVSGRVEANGRLDRSVHVVGALQHRVPGHPTSRIEGAGNVSWTRARSSFDLKLKAVPVELSALAESFPALARLEGGVSGPVDVRGSLNDLRVDADLDTRAGRVTLAGRFDLAARRPSYRAEGRIGSFRLDRLFDGLPATTVSGRYAVDGAGAGLDGADAAVRFDLDTARVGDLPLQGGTLVGRVRGGLATIDTLRVATPAGGMSVTGSFGLAPGRSGRLDVHVSADSLGALQALLFPDTAPGADDERRLAGAVGLTASLTGGISSFALDADATAARLELATARAHALRVHVTGADLLGRQPRLSLNGRADSVRVGPRVLAGLALDARYDAPAGSVRLSAADPAGGEVRLAGDFRRDHGATEGTIGEVQFGTGASTWKLAAPAHFRRAGGVLDVDSMSLARAGGGDLRVAGRVAWLNASSADVPVDFHVDLHAAPLADFLGLAEATPAGDGLFTGRLQVHGSARAPEVQGELSGDRIRWGDVALDHLDAQLGYASRRLDLEAQGKVGGAQVFSGSGLIPVDLSLAPVRERAPDEPVNYTLRADSMPASLLTALASGISRTSGRVDGQVKVRGTLRNPRFDGRFDLRNGGFSVDAAGLPYEDVEGSFRMDGAGEIGVDVTARSGGRAHATGSVSLGSSWTNPRLDLSVALSDFVAARRRDVEATASGGLHLGGRFRAPQLSGRLSIDRGAMYLDEIWRRYQIVALDDPLLFDVVDTTLVSTRRFLPTLMESDFLKNLAVDSFTVAVGREAWLRSRDLNVQLTGGVAVTYRRKDDYLRLAGSMSAVRGTYQLYGRRFDIKQGTVDFPGTPGLDPNLNFAATYRVRGDEDNFDIQAQVTGTLENPRVRLASEDRPSIGESDLVSYLLFGRPTYQLAANQKDVLKSAFTGTVYGYATSGIEDVARNLGFDYVSLTSAEVAESGAATNNIFQNFIDRTRLEAGWYLSDRLFLSFSQPLRSIDARRSTGVRLQWRFQPTWTSEFFSEDWLSRYPNFAPAADQAQALRRIYGFFLFREWGY